MWQRVSFEFDSRLPTADALLTGAEEEMLCGSVQLGTGTGCPRGCDRVHNQRTTRHTFMVIHLRRRPASVLIGRCVVPIEMGTPHRIDEDEFGSTELQRACVRDRVLGRGTVLHDRDR